MDGVASYSAIYVASCVQPSCTRAATARPFDVVSTANLSALTGFSSLALSDLIPDCQLQIRQAILGANLLGFKGWGTKLCPCRYTIFPTNKAQGGGGEPWDSNTREEAVLGLETCLRRR